METGAVTVSSIITAAGDIVTAAAGWVADWAGQIVETPFCLLLQSSPL